jgi:fumarate hydratase class II
VQPSDEAFNGMQKMGTCARLSAEMRKTADSFWKVANDMILLYSGPMEVSTRLPFYLSKPDLLLCLARSTQSFSLQ